MRVLRVAGNGERGALLLSETGRARRGCHFVAAMPMASWRGWCCCCCCQEPKIIFLFSEK
jgi:hypothetical protein